MESKNAFNKHPLVKTAKHRKELTVMSNATELAGIINLDALNKYNAEQVEAYYLSISDT